LGTTEKKSALDYSYWNNKLLYQISHNIDLNDFEKNFQNSVILSKNNLNLIGILSCLINIVSIFLYIVCFKSPRLLLAVS